MNAPKPPVSQFSIRLPPEDEAFVRELRKRGRSFGGGSARRSLNEVIRTIVTAVRTYFGLPRFMVDVLAADMESRRLDMHAYLQDLLARRYEELVRSTEAETAAPSQLAIRR
jgi:hypothetical protein